MSYFEYTADGHIIADYNGRKALDTRAPMLALVPAGTLSLTGYSISFPDFWKGTIYQQTRQSVTVPPVDYHGCSTWIGLVEQEWGPAEPSPRTLPDITLGSVPAGTDYLEIWVKLTRTVTPAKLLDLTLASHFPEGEWVKLDGTSCVIEELMGVARQFEFVLDGSTVKLRRYQSVNKDGGTVSPKILRVNGGAAAGNKDFFYAGTNAPEDGTKYVTYGEKIDEKGPSNNIPTHRPPGKENGSSNNVPCSMSHSGKSYASTWTGDIIIKPGRIGS